MSERKNRPEPSCPICGKAQAERYRPFCSKRCADIDLNRWLTGGYAFPVIEEEPGEGDAAGGPEEGDETAGNAPRARPGRGAGADAGQGN